MENTNKKFRNPFPAVGKVFKYEMISAGRIILPLYSILLVMSLIIGLFVMDKDLEVHSIGLFGTAKAVLVLPELREEVREGRAIICTGCTGTGNSKTFKCNDCGLQWDVFMEDAIRQSRNDHTLN